MPPHGRVYRTKGSLIAIILTILLPLTATADKDGQVQLPLEVYNQLVNSAKAQPGSPPARHALGKAGVSVEVSDEGSRLTAEVSVNLAVETYGEDWALVPVLPSGTAINAASVDGRPAMLVATPAGLSWAVKSSGSHEMTLTYQVDAHRSAAGYSLAVPVPMASSMTLEATLPGSNLDVAVIPSAGLTTSNDGDNTSISAPIPSTSAIQISWRTPSKKGHTISRAQYSGTLQGEAIIWRGELTVEIFGNEAATLGLLPKSATLTDLTVDGKKATIIVSGERFATVVEGRGMHTVVVTFQAPVKRDEGPPHVDLEVPEVPVSRFDLTLPGDKEITPQPAANVTKKAQDNETVSTVFMPMTSEVTFSWSEAVPEEVKADTRSNARLHHIAYAEEGVLYVRAMVVYDVTRGEARSFDLEVPPGVQINRITAESGGVSDWRLDKGQGGKADIVNVYLDRQVKGEFTFDVYYERLIGTGDKMEARIPIPLLRAVGVHRQRGMIALLANRELALKPLEENLVNKVGENQLPAFVRQAIEMTIAHTYKYVETEASLAVEAAAPERKQGKFDAQVNTLISLADVTMKGSATVEINVKSGSIMELQLALPPGVNFLSLTAPSMRTHKVLPGDKGQIIDIQFTQEMEGQFRVEATYERIMADGEAEVVVPTLSVSGAEVEQGRIAVEALTAVEVQASGAEQLSTMDINELPQQLILKTTNPILLGYKYVHVDPPYKLTLRITRHKELGIQDATIDKGAYKTLFTRDGLAVTKARFMVRNSRKQFLKVQLPERSEVWSVFVNGNPEKPALESEGDEDGPTSILIKVINSTQGFPVDLIYATQDSKVGSLGKINGQLPHPDIVVTSSQWDVYLPDGLTYGTLDSNMEVLEEGVAVSRQSITEEVGGEEVGGQQVIGPLRITVPVSGIKYTFEKLYANKADERAMFSISYASTGGATLASLLSILGTLMFWAGLICLLLRPSRVPANLAVGGLLVGATLLAVAVIYLGISPMMAFWVSLIIGVGLLSRYGMARMRRAKAYSLADAALAEEPAVAPDGGGKEAEPDEGEKG